MQIFLGGYPNYWVLPKAQKASTEFVEELKKLDTEWRERNKSLDMPYNYMLPTMIPNSITI